MSFEIAGKIGFPKESMLYVPVQNGSGTAYMHTQGPEGLSCCRGINGCPVFGSNLNIRVARLLGVNANDITPANNIMVVAMNNFFFFIF